LRACRGRVTASQLELDQLGDGMRTYPPATYRKSRARLFEPMLTCEDNPKNSFVGLTGRYSNRPDLLQQLRRVAAVLSDGGQDDGTGAEVASEGSPLAMAA
jgi:hypothetical protein